MARIWHNNECELDMGKPKILVVEGNEVVLRMLETKLSGAGYDVVAVASSTEAIILAQTESPAVMILDLGLPEKDMFNTIRDGFGVLSWLPRLLDDDATFPIIVHTADESPDTLEFLQKHKPYAVFKKGRDLNELVALIRQALARPKAA